MKKISVVTKRTYKNENIFVKCFVWSNATKFLEKHFLLKIHNCSESVSLNHFLCSTKCCK